MNDTQILNQLKMDLMGPKGRKELADEMKELIPMGKVVDPLKHIDMLAPFLITWIDSKRG